VVGRLSDKPSHNASSLRIVIAVLIALSPTPFWRNLWISLATTRLVRGSLNTQQEDGTWPPSQPLFHYPDVGNAQCFEYELLTQLLGCEPLQDELLGYFDNLILTAQKFFNRAEIAAGIC
jgi:hypothetical protein